jgi:energy-converting hydrogenase Eha subunit C
MDELSTVSQTSLYHHPSPLALFVLFPIQHVLQQFTILLPFSDPLGHILAIIVIVIAIFACTEDDVKHAMISVLLQRVSTIIIALTLIDCFKSGQHA